MMVLVTAILGGNWRVADQCLEQPDAANRSKPRFRIRYLKLDERLDGHPFILIVLIKSAAEVPSSLTRTRSELRRFKVDYQS